MPNVDRNFNPRTPCGVRRADTQHRAQGPPISIHAPLAGCDIASVRPLKGLMANFNPRTPCGVRRSRVGKIKRQDGFQSTHPLRGATSTRWPGTWPGHHFNPRTPCGVRLSLTICNTSRQSDFNPRTPCGVRRTQVAHEVAAHHHFNPRTPCGVRRRVRAARRTPSCRFQSTHPLRGATRAGADRGQHGAISIHAPLAGCDRTHRAAHVAVHISIHAPLAGCD